MWMNFLQVACMPSCFTRASVFIFRRVAIGTSPVYFGSLEGKDQALFWREGYVCTRSDATFNGQIGVASGTLAIILISPEL
jgi:hypothetical protein